MGSYYRKVSFINNILTCIKNNNANEMAYNPHKSLIKFCKLEAADCIWKCSWQYNRGGWMSKITVFYAFITLRQNWIIVNLNPPLLLVEHYSIILASCTIILPFLFFCLFEERNGFIKKVSSSFRLFKPKYCSISLSLFYTL